MPTNTRFRRDEACGGYTVTAEHECDPMDPDDNRRAIVTVGSSKRAVLVMTLGEMTAIADFLQRYHDEMVARYEAKT